MRHQARSPAELARSASVVIPTYNYGRFVETAIASVLSQSVVPAEIIVIDDGSVDDTASRVQAIAHPGLRYVYQRNAGEAAARNHGIRLAQGEWLAFLDADDFWSPDFLERLLTRALEATDAHLVRGQEVGRPGTTASTA